LLDSPAQQARALEALTDSISTDHVATPLDAISAAAAQSVLGVPMVQDGQDGRDKDLFFLTGTSS
jgi:hypothetical protein